MRNSSKEKSLEESIIDLYLGLKVRKTDDDNRRDEEREKLRKTNPKIVLEYVKSSIDILISTTVKEKLERISANNSDLYNLDETEVNEYEKQLRQVESEIRNHIRVSFFDIQIEHQMKLFAEVQQSKIDEIDNLNEELKKRLKEANEKLARFKGINQFDLEKKELEILRNENLSLKNIIKSYEDRNLNICDLEKKIRIQQSKYKNDLKLIEEKYIEKIKKYKKKIKKYEECLKKCSIKELKTDIPETDKSIKAYNRRASLTERLKKGDEFQRKSSENKLGSEKIRNEINNINYTIEEINHTIDIFDNRKVRNHKTNISNNNLTTNIRSENLDTINIETNSKTQRKYEKSIEHSSSKATKNRHLRTNSIAGTKPTQNNNSPNFKSNLNELKKTNKDTTPIYNYRKQNTSQLQNQKTKEQMANIINIYTSNMNNIKTKEINLKQFVNNNKTNKLIKENNSITARNYSNNNLNQH